MKLSDKYLDKYAGGVTFSGSKKRFSTACLADIQEIKIYGEICVLEGRLEQEGSTSLKVDVINKRLLEIEKNM